MKKSVLKMTCIAMVLTTISLGNILRAEMTEQNPPVCKGSVAISTQKAASNVGAGGALSIEGTSSGRISSGCIGSSRAQLKLGIIVGDKPGARFYGQVGALTMDNNDMKFYGNYIIGKGMMYALGDPALGYSDGNLHIVGANPLFGAGAGYIAQDITILVTPKMNLYWEKNSGVMGLGGGLQVYLDKTIGKNVKVTLLTAAGGGGNGFLLPDGKKNEMTVFFLGKIGAEIKVTENIAFNGAAFISNAARTSGKDDAAPSSTNTAKGSPLTAGGEVGVTIKM